MIDLPQNESEPMEFEQQGKSTSQQKHLIGTNFGIFNIFFSPKSFSSNKTFTL